MKDLVNLAKFRNCKKEGKEILESMVDDECITKYEISNVNIFDLVCKTAVYFGHLMRINDIMTYEELVKISVNPSLRNDIAKRMSPIVYDLNKRLDDLSGMGKIDSLSSPDAMSAQNVKLAILDSSPMRDKGEAYENALKGILDGFKRYFRLEYITDRGKYEIDGSLDMTLDVDELSKADANMSDYMSSNPYFNALEGSDMNTSTYSAINGMSIDVKYRIETFKEYMCNVNRYTPESFDAFFKAVNDYVKPRYFSSQINMDDVYKDFEHLLVKVPDDVKGPIYVSEVVDAINDHDAKTIKNSLAKLSMNKKFESFKNIYDDMCKGYFVQSMANLSRHGIKYESIDYDKEMNNFNMMAEKLMNGESMENMGLLHTDIYNPNVSSPSTPVKDTMDNHVEHIEEIGVDDKKKTETNSNVDLFDYL